jgi:thiol-disulfide isomerase/thioredoxin
VSILSELRTRSANRLPVEGRLPGFAGATGWLNSPPLTEADLREKVVLVDFWTYTCINWLRTLGYVRAWADKYDDQGLVLVGVHTPEFPFERDVENVRRAARDLSVDYPIALDSDYAIWSAFANRYWPAVYIADAQGRIRHHQFGEGGYEECERIIQRLLGEAGRARVADDLVAVADDGLEAQADWQQLRSPETYLGLGLTPNRAASNGAKLRLNDWSLSGDWTVEDRASVLNRAGGTITYRFHARDVHLVMRPQVRAASVAFRLLIDGEPPGAAHGLDVDEQGYGAVTEPRLYQLIRQPGSITDRTLEITFLAPGVEAYVFTFG